MKALALLLCLLLLPGYAFAGAPHWIKSVADDGGIVILDDDSVWGVDSIDKIDSGLWLVADDIIVVKNDDEPGYAYLLINTSENENVHAKYLGR